MCGSDKTGDIVSGKQVMENKPITMLIKSLGKWNEKRREPTDVRKRPETL